MASGSVVQPGLFKKMVKNVRGEPAEIRIDGFGERSPAAVSEGWIGICRRGG